MAGVKGMGKGNQNATLAPHERKRIKFDASLSGKRLAFFEEQARQEIYARTQETRTPTDREIEQIVRQMFYVWVDSLVE